MRRLLWPALTTVAMLLLGLGLGVWQLQRLAWKQGLLAEIELGSRTAAVPLTEQPPAFRRVVVQGQFSRSFARYGAEVRSTAKGGVMGARLISALQRPGEPTLIVDRGWAPLDFDGTPPAGAVTLEGYIRPAEKPVRFGAVDDPAERRFYALDPVAIGASLGFSQVDPFSLVLLGAQGTLPEPAAALPRPSNDHLSYALTWFAMSFGLMVIFILYARQVVRTNSAELILVSRENR